jgi:Domain of unknown function (DUF4350)
MGRRDTWLVVVLLLVIVLLAALAGTRAGQGDGPDPRASTYVRSGDGAAALYWTLQELRIPVRRWRQPFLDADSLRGTVALLAASVQPSADEMEALLEHVRRGGTLIYAPGAYEHRSAAFDSLGIDVRWLKDLAPWQDETRTAAPRPHRWTQGVARVTGFQRAFVDTTAAFRASGAETLLVVEGAPAAATWRVGEGRVIAFADAGPLRNERLKESGAATVFARAAAELARGDTLWFDEYHHGFGSSNDMVGGMLRHAGRVLPRGFWVQLLVAFALLLWLVGRRFGAPLPPPPLRRRSPLEHVEALAGAYRQAGAKRTARRLLLAGLARRLGRRAPPDDAAAAEMLGRMARQSPVGGDAAAQLEKDFKRGADAELVSLARGVDRYLDEVRRP